MKLELQNFFEDTKGGKGMSGRNGTMGRTGTTGTSAYSIARDDNSRYHTVSHGTKR